MAVISCVISSFFFNILISSSFSLRFGFPANNLHFPADKLEDYYGKGVQIIEATSPLTKNVKNAFKNTLRKSLDSVKSRLGNTVKRSRRYATSSLPDNITSIFMLQDSNYQMMIHWAGDNSLDEEIDDVHVVVILTKSPAISLSSNHSNLYISYNYGRTFIKKNKDLNGNGPVSLSGFYNSPASNSHYVFTDEENRRIYTTTNFGRNFSEHAVPFKPVQIAMHPRNKSILIGFNPEGSMRVVYISKDFGRHWEEESRFVKAFFWGGAPPQDPEYSLYVQQEAPDSSFDVVRIDTEQEKEHMILRSVSDFELRGNYMFATRNMSHGNGSKSIQFWVSHERAAFQQAIFPTREIDHKEYFVADASEGQVFLCVHKGNQTDLLISESHGIRFSESLHDILYRSKSIFPFNHKPYADFQKIHGLRGIYLVTKFNRTSSFNRPQLLTAYTMITFNKGASWQMISPPHTDLHHHTYNCQHLHKANTNDSGCMLQITQKWHRQNLYSQAVPILSRESSPGLILATGSVGYALQKENHSIFLSRDGGFVWKEVLEGSHYFAMGDFGGILVAVKQKETTNEIRYSYDEGETWHEHVFSPRKMLVYGLLTEPGERSAIFSIFGSSGPIHSWIIVKVDLKSVFDRKCNISTDYNTWSPSSKLWDSCLLGQKLLLQRRLPHSKCYNGVGFSRVVSLESCLCSGKDYECDVDYSRVFSSGLVCTKDAGVSEPSKDPPDVCQEGTYYTVTRGYRKIAGDKCKSEPNGHSLRYEPDRYVCPVKERDEILLYSRRNSIHRVLLNGGTDQTLVPSYHFLLNETRSIDYDFKQNCLFWADLHAIKQICFNKNSTVRERVLVQGTGSTQSFAYDWSSELLYWITSAIRLSAHEAIPGAIFVAKRNGSHRRMILRSQSVLEHASNLQLYPKAGLMFWSLYNRTNSYIMMAHLDGRNIKPFAVLHQTVFCMVVDEATDRLFWSTLSGVSHRNISSYGNTQTTKLSSNKLPKLMTVYEDSLFWWNDESLAIHASHKDSVHWSSIYKANVGTLTDLRAYQRQSQMSVNSPCENNNGKCHVLCLNRPGIHGLNRTCLCPENILVEKTHKSGDETCGCGDGEQLVGLQCIPRKGKQCSEEKFFCSQGSISCIPKSWRCDRDFDCADQADELGCPWQGCQENEMQCNNGKCVLKRWICDHDNDCGDGSDEPANCTYPSCPPHKLSCGSGQCIEHSWKCDGEADCRDSSDELNCAAPTTVSPPTVQCNGSHFNCGNGVCISIEWKCDGDNDCEDFSDEGNCSNISCSHNEFLCGKQTCLPVYLKCDGKKDCPDGSDERACRVVNTTDTPWRRLCHSPDALHCDPLSPRNECYLSFMRCNGIKDCSNGFDEENCFPIVTSTTPNGLYCGDQFGCHHIPQCIGKELVCDGQYDCMDKSDELCDVKCKYEQYQCRASDICLSQRFVCDGQHDCPGRDDEEDCADHVTSCSDDQFKCWESGLCIADARWCDGTDDCADRSDESDCKSKGVSGLCKSWQMHCGEKCLHPSLHCDGVSDCPGSADETYCSRFTSTEYALGFADKWSWTVRALDVGRIMVSWTNLTINYRPISEVINITLRNTEQKDFHLHSKPKQRSDASTSVTFHSLLAYTEYMVVLFVVKRTAKDTSYARLALKTLVTPQGMPSAPQNLQLAADPSSRGSLVISWSAPKLMRGLLQHYAVYIMDLSYNLSASWRRQIVTEKIAGKRVTYTVQLEDGHRYEVKVAAVTNQEGYDSDVRNITLDAASITSCVESFRVTTIAAGAVTLAWTAPSNYKVDHYEVCATCGLISVDSCYRTEKTTLKVEHLSPAMEYEFSVRAHNKNGYGVFCETKTASLPGKRMPTVDNLTFESGAGSRVDGESEVSVSWKKPNFKEVLGFTLYWSKNENALEPSHVHSAALNLSVRGKTSISVSNLEPCQDYFFRLQVTEPAWGPLGVRRHYQSDFDEKAGPRGLVVNCKALNGTLATATVEFESACMQSQLNEDYYIKMVEVTGDGKPYFQHCRLNSSRMHAHCRVTGLKRGATYNISVQRALGDSEYSRPSEHVQLVAAAYPPPTSVKAVVSDSGTVVSWKAPKELPTNPVFYEILHAKDWVPGSDVTFKLISLVRGNDKGNFSKYLLRSLLEKHHHSFYVRVHDAYGYPGRSSNIETIYFIKKASLVAKDAHHSSKLLLSLLLSSIGIIIVLVIALSVFFFHHKQLQRSFLSFANSHYDTRSGQASFSTGDLGDDEQPAIQGFSDDEPLVLA